MNITLYTTGPACIRCRLTSTLLKDSGVAFTTIDIRTNPQAQRYVTEELGYVEAPVVVVTESPTEQLPHEAHQHDPAHPQTAIENLQRWHWSGFRPDRLRALVEQASAQQGERRKVVSTS